VTSRTPLTAILADAVDRQARELVARVRTSSPFWHLLEYHMGWSGHAGVRAAARPGKRVRPLILLMVTQALGGDVTAALPAAAAIELLHNAALVFDDIQDQGSLRRGRPAVWRLCGAHQAMNVGVALQALVHLAAAETARGGLSADRALATQEELALCTLRLVEGQHQDLAFQGRARPTIDDYMRMCGAKTGSLMASAAYLGALLAGREEVAEPARRLGYHLGMYLQIEDDIAGIWGQAAALGKDVHDLESGKKTLPLLYVFHLDDAPAELKDLGERFFGGEALDGEAMGRLRQYALELGGRAYAEEMAGFHRELARRALDEVGAGPRADLLAVLDDIAAALAAAV
jgi:geranylgeranyl diphosphate synthase type I